MPSMRTYSPRVTHRLLQLLVTITFRYDDTKLIAIQHRHRRFEEFEVDLYVVIPTTFLRHLASLRITTARAPKTTYSHLQAHPLRPILKRRAP